MTENSHNLKRERLDENNSLNKSMKKETIREAVPIAVGDISDDCLFSLVEESFQRPTTSNLSLQPATLKDVNILREKFDGILLPNVRYRNKASCWNQFWTSVESKQLFPPFRRKGRDLRQLNILQTDDFGSCIILFDLN